MNKEKLEEIKKEREERKQEAAEQKEETKQQLRQIIIETDGNSINIVKAEVAGRYEFLKILEEITFKLRQ